MHFLLRLRGMEMHFLDAKPLTLRFKKPKPSTFTINKHVQVRGTATENRIDVDVIVRDEPPLNVQKYLKQTAEKNAEMHPLPVQFTVDPQGRPRNLNSIHRYDIPNHIEQYLIKIQTEMRDIAERALRLLRWRTDAFSGVNVIPPIGNAFFSFDTKTWFGLCTPIHSFMEVQREIDVSDGKDEEIAEFVNDGRDEPIAHALWREAWVLKNSNPQAALLMGVASAEIGFKQFAASLLPSTQWLLDNLPSPPLDKMIREYLPTLPTKLKIAGKVVAPPEELMKLLKDGIAMRNKLAHTGKQVVRRSKVHHVLSAIHDLLRLFDYYAGHEWALDYITKATLSSLDGFPPQGVIRKIGDGQIPVTSQMADLDE